MDKIEIEERVNKIYDKGHLLGLNVKNKSNTFEVLKILTDKDLNVFEVKEILNEAIYIIDKITLF